MKKFVFIILLSTFWIGGLINCSAQASEFVGSQALPIRKGKAAFSNEIHATVSIVSTGDLLRQIHKNYKNTVEVQFHCTGTLIAPTVVVTAAHCMVNQEGSILGITREYKPEDFNVIAGVLNAGAAPAEAHYPVRKIVRHEGYSKFVSSKNCDLCQEDGDDIALLLLERPVSNVSPASIATLEQVETELCPGTSILISGYGDRCDQVRPLSGILEIATAPFIRRGATEFIVGNSDTPGVWFGDSGGPAYLSHKEGVSLLGAASAVRIDSWRSLENCQGESVYTLVPAYIDWIQEHSEGAYPDSSLKPS